MRPRPLSVREGDWLRLWNSVGIGLAHEVWVGRNGVVYENSGLGGCVQTNTLENVLAGRTVIQIVARTAPEGLDRKETFAKSKLGTPWAGFYCCQDFASEVATGKAESFQRDGILFAAVLAVGIDSTRNIRRRSDAPCANDDRATNGHLSGVQ